MIVLFGFRSLCVRVRSCVVMRCDSLTHSVLTARHDSRCNTGDWGVGAGSGTLSVINRRCGRTNGKTRNTRACRVPYCTQTSEPRG